MQMVRASILLGPCLVVLISIATSASAQQGPAPREIVLQVGEQQTISAAGVRNFSISGNVVDVRLTPDGALFVIVGLRAGTTVLLLIREDGTQRRIEVQVLDV